MKVKVKACMYIYHTYVYIFTHRVSPDLHPPVRREKR